MRDFRFPVWGYGDVGTGIGPFDSKPSVPVVYIFPFLSYLAGSKSASVGQPTWPHASPTGIL